MRLRRESQRYGNERRIHALNSEVLDETGRVEKLKDKWDSWFDNKHSLNSFDCALRVLLVQS